jgi:WbqC-like protein family
MARNRVAIIQSSYIPWKGYFDLIRRVDEFILYDDAQYTKRDWRNRNRIKGPNGPLWLTIPIDVKGRYFQAIKDTRVADGRWRERHWRTLQACYARAPYYRDYRSMLEELYLGCTSESLSEINRRFICRFCELLAFDTRVSCSMDYRLVEGRTERLVALCQQAGAREYLSGPAARAYIDLELFADAGITVTFMDYSGYPEYEQLYPPFDHHVSIVDLLVHTGPRALAHMLPLPPAGAA